MQIHNINKAAVLAHLDAAEKEINNCRAGHLTDAEAGFVSTQLIVPLRAMRARIQESLVQGELIARLSDKAPEVATAPAMPLTTNVTPDEPVVVPPPALTPEQVSALEGE